MGFTWLVPSQDSNPNLWRGPITLSGPSLKTLIGIIPEETLPYESSPRWRREDFRVEKDGLMFTE